MDLPKHLKIGFLDYAVEPFLKAEADALKLYGQADHQKQLIRIQTEGVSDARVAEILIHEILHCVWHCWRIYNTDDEERTVDALGHGLATVLLDNPELAMWLHDAMGHSDRVIQFRPAAE